MKLHLFRYDCINCDTTFKSPQIIGNPYGEFLMRNKRGKIVYLNAFEDPVFSQVEKLFDMLVTFKSIENLDDSNIFQSIFSIACDPSSDGLKYSINQKPVCPDCKKTDIGYWGPTNPPEIVEIDIPIVTHERWNKLSDVEKKVKVEEAIEQMLTGKNNL